MLFLFFKQQALFSCKIGMIRNIVEKEQEKESIL